jgi:hypothetical protein
VNTIDVSFLGEYLSHQYGIRDGATDVSDFDGNSGILLCTNSKYKIVSTSLIACMKLAKHLDQCRDKATLRFLGIPSWKPDQQRR